MNVFHGLKLNMRLPLTFMLTILACSCLTPSAGDPTRYCPPSVPIYTYSVVHAYPHDSAAYTQGLLFYDGYLYESTGRYGQSTLRKVDLASGRVVQVHHLPSVHWGEGITLYQDRIIQLTWRSQTGFIYAFDSFAMLGEFTYPTEGWGITTCGEKLVMSDGSATLYFLDPVALTATGTVEVHDKDGPIRYLNELEFVKGDIFANIWGADMIAIIDPEDGNITGWIDLSGLLPTQPGNFSAEVLNGIAYDTASDRLFVTGKLWPCVFEIRLVLRSI